MTDELSRVTEDSARGGFFLFSGATTATIIMALSAILVGRLLGPELYGQYNLVLVIPNLLLLFTDLGINAGITKYAASLRTEGLPDRIPAIIRHGMLLRLITGTAAVMLSITFTNVFTALINRPDLASYIQLTSILVIFQVIYTTANSAFVGIDKSEYSALTTNIQAIAKTILQITLVILGFSLTGALIGTIGGFAIAAALSSTILFLKLLRPTQKTQNTQTSYAQNLKLLTRYGAPLYVAVVLTGLIPLYQQIILAFFAPDTAIGNFKAATNFVALLTIIATAITTALLPAFSKLEHSAEKINAFFKKANKYTCIIIVPTTTLVILFSQQIVQLLYGTTYDSAALFLSVSALIYFLAIIGHLSLTSLFNGLGKTRLTLYATIINFITLTILSPLLAQAYSVIGAIAASLIAGFSAAVYAAITAVRKLRIQFEFKKTITVYIISAISSIPAISLILYTSLSPTAVLIVGALSYLIIYATLMPIMRTVDQTELEALTKITGRIPLLRWLAKPLLKYQLQTLLLIDKTSKT
ncbi:MAG: oligosaccharide flippase family protein [Candidatus Bathyarchaeota archaeon]|nr:oligosaccharide flippase family protein [Candidatus Bathyarchaeota archaeon]